MNPTPRIVVVDHPQPADPADFAVGGAVLHAATAPVLGVCPGVHGLVTRYGGPVERLERGMCD